MIFILLFYKEGELILAGRIWTEEDINYLEEKWGSASVDIIAKKLNRTIVSVRKKLQL